MSQIIPGGRPRASSDGDILDEELCSTLFVNLKEHSSEESRKNPRKTTADVIVNNSSIHLHSSNDVFDSDGELSSQSQSGSTRSRRRGIFKSMRKAVNRAFVKNPNTSKTEKPHRTSDISKVWTPDIRNCSERNSSYSNGTELTDTGTMSTARPLITNTNAQTAVPKWKNTPGTVGIKNHGSTCFMNAVLQCLSSTDSFTEYFIKDLYKIDLKNSTNGKRSVFRSNYGEVTEQLAHLLRCLWSGKYTHEVSKEFKAVVARSNSQYKGDQQHDSQEFLLWLFDRIHEDVSTFNKKKPKPQKAQGLKSDEELASEALSINGDSFVHKLFQALHSSTLTCPSCGERSRTFDPYLCVSLPLPQTCPRAVFVVVVSLDSHHFHEVKMAFTLNQYDGVKELRELVAADTKIPSKQLLLIQVKDDGFGATYSDEQPLSDIPENEYVYAVEAYSDDASMHSSVQEFDAPTLQILVMHVEVPGDLTRSYRFGSLSMLKVRRDITWKNLQKEILLKMEDSVCEEIMVNQKLSNLFSLKIDDGSTFKNYLPSDVEMPLYTQSAERAYTTLDEDFGPPHIKILAEWDPQTKKTVVTDDQKHMEIHSSVTAIQSNPPGQGKVSIDECLKLYTQKEKLIGDDAWLCPHCKQQQQGTIKTLGLWSLPNILVLHLKRFKQTGHRRSKLNTLVDFPVENLDMSPHLTNQNQIQFLKHDDYTYDLIGVSNHFGNMSGGHYIAYCRSPVDGKWREFNDDKVRTLKEPIATDKAYLLFYQRRSLSKEINQRLFTGSHWVFSLSLAPSERIENGSLSSETVSGANEQGHQLRRSRSRSASPSAHPQTNKESMGPFTRPLTPQPFRPPFTADRDRNGDASPTSPSSPDKNDSARKPRPVQRQVSAPGLYTRRERSAGTSQPVGAKEPNKTLHSRSVEVDQDFSADQSKKASKTELSSDVNRSHSLTRPKTTDRDKPQVSIGRRDPLKNNDLATGTSKVFNHQALSSSRTLEPDAKYPSTSYDHTRYSDNIKVSNFDPASVLQVKFDDIPKHTQKPYTSSVVSDSESARRSLAQLIKQESLNKALSERAHVPIDPIEEEENSYNFTRVGSRIYGAQKSSELAKLKPLNLDPLNDVSVPQRGTNGHSDRDSFTSDAARDSESELTHGKWFNHSSRFTNKGGDYALLEESDADSDEYDISPDLTTESEFISKFQNARHYDGFRKLADKHFGSGSGDVLEYNNRYKSRFADDTECRTLDYISPHLIGDVTRLDKFATIGRASDTSQAGRYEREFIPRSSTDHNIHYSSSLAPPPSPTPPHSIQEERAFSHNSVSTSLPSSTSNYLSSGRPPSREMPPIHSSDHRGPQLNGNLSARSRTLPGYTQSNRDSKYNFRRPRGVWGVKSLKPTSRNLNSIPTPCLRESSV